MTDPRTILQADRDCIAFVILDEERANVHILRPGEPPLSVLGAVVQKRKPKDERDAK